MREVVLYIAMSLDGYIADSQGDVSWLMGQDENNEEPGSYPDFISTIDTVILGYRTYHQIATELFPEKWIYSGMKSYVLTHKTCESTHEIIFTQQKIQDLIEEIRVKPGKDIWICGGAEIANQLIGLNLIDKYCISVIPTILGKGIRLFEEHDAPLKLELVSTQNYNGIVDLWYQRRS